MHRNGRNSVEDGKAVAWRPGSCRTAERDGARQARLQPSFSTQEKAGAAGGGLRGKNEGGALPRRWCHPRAAICASAALRSTDAPGFSTGRSKGFQISPTTCS